MVRHDGNTCQQRSPILVSQQRAGTTKSTFCKAPMPPALSRYYMDNLKLSAQGNRKDYFAEMGLLEHGWIWQIRNAANAIIEESDANGKPGISAKLIKEFPQLAAHRFFIGTSNRFDLLTDPTGSRRFICIEAEHLIDCEGIMHDQIYAQLKAEPLRHPLLVHKEEEREPQRHNAAFYHPSGRGSLSCLLPDC